MAEAGDLKDCIYTQLGASPRGWTSSSDLYRHYTHSAYIYMQVNTHTHQIIDK